MWNMQEFGIQIESTMTGHSRTTTSTRKELCTWCYVCVVNWSWRIKPSCWTLRRPTPMTTWKPRSRETTRSTTWNSTVTWTRERARCVAVFVVLVLCCHTHLLHTSHGSRCSSVCLFHSIPWSSPCMHDVSVLSDFLDLFIIFTSLLSFLIILNQFLLPFNFTEVKL